MLLYRQCIVFTRKVTTEARSLLDWSASTEDPPTARWQSRLLPCLLLVPCTTARFLCAAASTFSRTGSAEAKSRGRQSIGGPRRLSAPVCMPPARRAAAVSHRARRGWQQRAAATGLLPGRTAFLCVLRRPRWRWTRRSLKRSPSFWRSPTSRPGLPLPAAAFAACRAVAGLARHVLLPLALASRLPATHLHALPCRYGFKTMIESEVFPKGLSEVGAGRLPSSRQRQPQGVTGHADSRGSS